METHPRVLELAAGRTIINPPTIRSDSWRNSRLFVNPDGSVQRVLDVLATSLGYDGGKAYWKDRDWTNETPENVGFAAAPAPRRKSAYGIPAGTPEYHRAYRAANKERFTTYAAKHKAAGPSLATPPTPADYAARFSALCAAGARNLREEMSVDPARWEPVEAVLARQAETLRALESDLHTPTTGEVSMPEPR
jgi:hypothetical protein